MPMYEYRCEKCGGVFETIQRFSDAPLTTHEGCGGAVERLISAPALQFKGSGWYITDYAKGGNTSAPPKSGEKSEGKSDAKSDSKSDSKSDAKADSKTSSTPPASSGSTSSNS